MKTTKSPSQNHAAPLADHSENNAVPIKIVGIGASAGGLEAFEEFFRHMPADSGMAFVLVQHLAPSHASLLTDILQRSTHMPVVEVRNQMPIVPNTVYVIPPSRDMEIFHGRLQLSMPNVPCGQRMPVDAFLRSLAADQKENAVGIIFSGTGTDGTLGCRAVLGAGGITIAQEPSTARYDGMPSSVIQAGYATLVLPIGKIPAALKTESGEIIADTVADAIPSPPSQPESEITRILILLRSITGHDFSLYKESTIGRRIERRMLQNNIKDTGIYFRYLKEKPNEVHTLFKEMLINVTSFFRDPGAFSVLEEKILPELVKDKPEGYTLRVWVVGCATGEEAYSITMLLRELMDRQKKEFKVQIYATDLDEDVIAIARTGIYPPNIAQDVTQERLRRFFVEEEAGFRVKKEIREMIVFAVQNVIKYPPFTKLDLLCCRNLLINLKPELQARLIPMFHYALKPEGVLFLSPSESTGNHGELFKTLDRKWKLYRAIPSLASSRTVMAQLKINNQTTIEELETSKEELQSVNEELVTVNSELHSKIEQLAGMQNDMKNLLDNISVGIIFLDQNLVIRRFTPEAVRIYPLAPSDVGRPLIDIKSLILDEDDLQHAAHSVLESLIPYERELQLGNGTWIMMRIQPYRTLDNLIDGVVLTFTDITARIKSIAVQDALVRAECIVNAIREPLVVLDEAFKVISATQAFYKAFGLTPEETLGYEISQLKIGLADFPELHQRLENVLRNDQAIEGYQIAPDIADIGRRKLKINANLIMGKIDTPPMILLSLEIEP